jgi:hypothetical protein
MPSGVKDWLRAWPVGFVGENGDVPENDFGRASRGIGPDEGDAELLFMGVVRHFGPF